MGRSKKGRISGTKRQELNNQRANAALTGKAEGIAFARVTKMVGAGHVRVAIPYKFGVKELQARIPNVLGRRGATPITTKDIVSIYVGTDWDPDVTSTNGEHFDITAILTSKQAYQLFKDGILPEWMVVDMESDKVDPSGKTAEGGYEFDYGHETKENSSNSGSESSDSVDPAPTLEQSQTPVFGKRVTQRDAPSEDAPLNIDDI
jgi:hypothetical protein